MDSQGGGEAGRREMASIARSNWLRAGYFGLGRCEIAGDGVLVFRAKPGGPDTIGAAAYQAANPATEHGTEVAVNLDARSDDSLG